jgi:3-hydroxyacyl-[acyl-carrier-protein] dehydratase
MPPPPILDLHSIDFSRIVADQEAIRKVNPQRFEMEQLTAVVLFDPEEQVVVAYKDLTEDDFWVRGHMPGYPLMPGVIMCEAAAQLCSYYSTAIHLLKDGFLGFGGMEDVRFRGQVRPGQRLVIVAKPARLHHRQTIFDTQGFVDGNMVFHARIIGVPLSPQSTA